MLYLFPKNLIRTLCYSLDYTFLVHDVGLEAEHGKHHQCGQDRGEEVDDGHQHSVKVAVVITFVVGGEGDDSSEAQAQGEEHLGGRFTPHLQLQHLLQLDMRNGEEMI